MWYVCVRLWWGVRVATRTAVSPLVTMRITATGSVLVYATIYLLHRMAYHVIRETKAKQKTTKQFFSTLWYAARARMLKEWKAGCLSAQLFLSVNGSCLCDMVCVSVCSHEMRGPCQSILNGTRMFAEAGDLSPVQEHAADTVFNSARELVALLNDILGTPANNSPWWLFDFRGKG